MGTLQCLKVGWGNACIINSDNATFLIDCHNIEDYSELLPSNKIIKGVFITHQHKDHYSGLKYLKDEGYTIGFLIYSPYDRQYGDSSVTLEEWEEFNSLKDYFDTFGTKLYFPFRQESFDEPWWIINGLKFWMIGPPKITAKSETREIHDASLIIDVMLGERVCLFAGDASDISLEYVANNTNNYCNDILYSSHHGSLNGAHLEFIKKCKAKYTVISTASGVYPGNPDPVALKRYEDHTEHTVYRTDINGSIKWTF